MPRAPIGPPANDSCKPSHAASTSLPTVAVAALATRFMTAEFCDTNVLVYAFDTSAGFKRERARSLLERLWEEGSGVVSVQVLQELFVTLTRKVKNPLALRDARALVADFAAWHVVAPQPADVLTAIDGAERWQVSFWDAMVLQTASKAGAEILWSEDLSDGQSFDGVLVQNPFGDTANTHTY